MMMDSDDNVDLGTNRASLVFPGLVGLCLTSVSIVFRVKGIVFRVVLALCLLTDILHRSAAF